MANYPTSDPSFSARTNGQVIDAAHVNGLQDEVVAIGAALRGTLQHALTVGTGGATVSSGGLTVSTGNTVLGQNLSVAGTSTFAGKVTLSTQVSAPSQPRALVYSSAALALAAGAFTEIAFESEEYDVGGLHSTASNPGRLTIPAGSSGLYVVGACVRLSTGVTGVPINVRLLKNSTTEVGGSVQGVLSSSGATTFAPSVPMVLDGGDFVTVEAFPTGSTASTPAATARRGTSELWAMKVW